MHRTNIPGTVRAKASLMTLYFWLETRFEIPSAPRIPFVVWTSEKEEKKKHKLSNKPAKNQIDIKCIFEKKSFIYQHINIPQQQNWQRGFPENNNNKNISEIFKILSIVDWLFGFYAVSTLFQPFNGD